MRWPSAWKDPSKLGLLDGTPINFLLVDKGIDLGPVVTRAEQQGLKVADAASPPGGVTLLEGVWPGVKLSQAGTVDRVSAGPTGDPWVDSNGWKIRLTAAIHPGTEVWVDAAPQKAPRSAEPYLIAIADAAAYGGRWIISLDGRLAAEIADQKPAALESWKRLTGAAAFFSAREEWSRYLPEAVLGIVSDFSGPNEFISHELLNLLARTNQQYRMVVKSGVSATSLHGLKAVLCPDAEPPAQALRDQVLAFVRRGGLLITGSQWRLPPGASAAGYDHPRFALHVFGEGKLAVARNEIEDPYLLANDSVVLMSHRHDLLRFWNGGAVGSFFTMAPNRRRALVQMLFYAAALFGNPTVRVAGQYRTAKLWTLGQSTPGAVEMENQKDALELHLPRISQYAAVELEVETRG